MCETHRVRFIVYGAGAVGGVVGARLYQHGHEVGLIARGAHAQAIQAGGLRLESPDESVTLKIPVATGPAGIAWRGDDVVLLAVKSQDTSGALDELRSAAPATVAVACLQNGVDNERGALRLFADVYGICVMCPTTHLEPGVVQANSAPITGLLDIGRYPAGVDDTARQVSAALGSSSFDSTPLEDIMRWKYAKLLLNLGNAVEAVCGPPARAGPLPDLAKREAVACLQAAGIDCASEAEDAARRGSLLTVRPINGQRREGGSSWQSLTRRAGAIETDYLNGEIVLLGRVHGVPTPVNELLARLAGQLASGRAAPGSVPEPTVLEMLAR